VLRGTRMPVDAIVGNFDCDYDMSVAEISEQFEIPHSCSGNFDLREDSSRCASCLITTFRSAFSSPSRVIDWVNHCQ